MDSTLLLYRVHAKTFLKSDTLQRNPVVVKSKGELGCVLEATHNTRTDNSLLPLLFFVSLNMF